MTENKIGLYLRLSKDDDKCGESASIESQRVILNKFVSERGGKVAEEYVDDGYSGTDFERPAVKRMLEDAKSGKIDTVIVKDLSRFGRNYIQVGQYIDYLFPAYGIRFIAISDNLDTADRCSAAMDMMPIMNVFNEWHAASTSKKIRAVLQASQRSGKYTNWSYPYGYKAGCDELRTAVIDEEAAAVVRRIYDLRLQGNSYRAIAKILTELGFPNPSAHFIGKDGKKTDKNFSPYWCPKTVYVILSDVTYTGCTVQHRTTSVSYKNHKVIKVPQESRIVKPNAHAAIIDGETWEKVQQINKSASRGRADKNKTMHALSGLLVCADCGKKLKRKAGASGARFICRTYADAGNKYCSSHAIGESAIEKLVLEDIRSMLNCKFDENLLTERFNKEYAKRYGSNKYRCEERLKEERARLKQLERLLCTAFEDKVSGKLPESVFLSLLESYQLEKQTLKNSVLNLEKAVVEDGANGAQSYLKKFKSYAACESLTREMCLQLIDFIEVGEKLGVGSREICVYYRFAEMQTLL